MRLEGTLGIFKKTKQKKNIPELGWKKQMVLMTLKIIVLPALRLKKQGKYVAFFSNGVGYHFFP